MAGGDQQEIIVLADIHRENVDEEGTFMSFQVTQYNQTRRSTVICKASDMV